MGNAQGNGNARGNPCRCSEWDVNLRMLQDDLTFKDTIEAHASIYAILDGKAILELWDSAPISGCIFPNA